MSKQNILTLSFEIRGATMPLSPAERVDLIVDSVSRYETDIVLTAGYAVETDEHWDRLTERLSQVGWNGLLVSEIWHSNAVPSDDGKLLSCGVACDFSDIRPKRWNLGKQYVATSAQIQSRTGEVILDEVCANLDQRTFHYRNLKCGFLNCGELNLINGRVDPRAVRTEISSWIDGLDILFNPTHDAMGNHGTVNAKRRWISSGGKKERIYVSSSNWNTQKDTARGIQRQSRSRRSLHSVYFGGRECVPEIYQNGPCEMRMFQPFNNAPPQPISSSSRPRGKAAEPLWIALQERYDQVLAEAKFDWLFVPGQDERSDEEELVHSALVEHCQNYSGRFNGDKKKECHVDKLYQGETRGNARSLEFDFYLPKIGCAIEFDERQHFTLEREVALAAYPDALKQEAWHSEWREICLKIRANDADPPCRDWQRAFRDSVRDMRARKNGVTLIRAHFGEEIWAILDRVNSISTCRS